MIDLPWQAETTALKHFPIFIGEANHPHGSNPFIPSSGVLDRTRSNQDTSCSAGVTTSGNIITGGSGIPLADEDGLGAFWECLDEEMQPMTPIPSCPQSQRIFEEHKEKAHKYLVTQEQIVYLQKLKTKLQEKLSEEEQLQQMSQQRYENKISELQNKIEANKKYRAQLKEQLESIHRRKRTEPQSQCEDMSCSQDVYGKPAFHPQNYYYMPHSSATHSEEPGSPHVSHSTVSPPMQHHPSRLQVPISLHHHHTPHPTLHTPGLSHSVEGPHPQMPLPPL